MTKCTLEFGPRTCSMLLAAVSLFASSSSHAVLDGEEDGKRHRFVGLIVYQLEHDGRWYAPQGGNAVLVASKVAVTAGHVLGPPWLPEAQLGIKPIAVGVTFDEKPVDLNTPPDLGTHWRVMPASRVHVVRSSARHPKLFESPEAPNDVGVLVFEKPVKGIPTARIPRPGLFDLLERLLEPRLAIVGYGGRQPIFPPPLGGGNRTSGTAPIVDLTANVVVTGQLNEGDVNGGAGDSGAPALFAHGMVIGVLSGVAFAPDPASPSYTQFSRLDNESACAFLKSYVRLNCRPISH
jgi:hypothetical protein